MNKLLSAVILLAASAVSLAQVGPPKYLAYTTSDGINFAPETGGGTAALVTNPPPSIVLYCISSSTPTPPYSYGVCPQGSTSDGTVTSVGFTPDSIHTVTGSPITTSGVIAETLNNQSANTVFAGPPSGSAAAPTFRSLVALDLPNVAFTNVTNTFTASQIAPYFQVNAGDPGTGTAVSDFVYRGGGGAIRNYGSSTNYGSFYVDLLTPAGGLVTPLTCNLATQPTASTARCLIPTIVSSNVFFTPGTITASATPAIGNGSSLQTITLSANATPTITGITSGQHVVFQICQPATGGPYTWTWPAAVHGGVTIGTTASTCSIQGFDSFNGTTLVAESTGVINIAP